MTPEIWTIIGVGIALAGLILNGQYRHNSRIDKMDERLSDGVTQLRERMAHLEGLLEGLREAITRNRAA